MVTISNAHNDTIHDAVLDYYGKRLATCSSDKTIKIFEIEGESQKLVETLKGHEGPVWRVDWAHPKFGTILASCSYDGKVLIWKEENSKWSLIASHAVHSASVNSVQWAPHEYGALLLVASSDGKVSVVEFKENNTSSPIIIDAHSVGVNSASWAPAMVEEDFNGNGIGGNNLTVVNGDSINPNSNPNSNSNSNSNLNANSGGSNGSNNNNGNNNMNSGGTQNGYQQGKTKISETRRFVTGGADNLVKVWKYNREKQTYELENTLEGHSDWIRDVSWSPSILLRSYIASVSQDRTCTIWTREHNSTGPWKKTLLQKEKFPDVLWRASWSLSGNILAISGGDNRVTLWKENLNGDWESAGDVHQ